MTQRGTSSDPVGGSTPGRRACEVVTTTLHIFIFRPLKKKKADGSTAAVLFIRGQNVLP